MITFTLNNKQKELLMYHKDYLIDKEGGKYSYRIISSISGNLPKSLINNVREQGFFEGKDVKNKFINGGKFL